MKKLCNCGKLCVWIYAPVTDSKESPYYCDDCVPRGCSCNYRFSDKNAYNPPLEDFEIELPEGVENVDWKWVFKEKTKHREEIKPNTCWVYLDEKGREYPCCEYDYDEDGFDIE